ncbi:winged helix-turn-helix domain-containing protein [Collimonas humicola]|uniref:winged helix-turn-helix domain-containing protein n=1 Tax=Collimonas humicola TaxID=2825886 RepID=UPI001B8D9A6B|nr:winged helix-turn-helix domain-containing protein [Collimonas humicola]
MQPWHRKISGIAPASVGFTVDQHGFVAYKNAILDLPPKERGALSLLLHAWPKSVSKKDFAQHVWNGRMSNESLARCMAQLRRVLSHIGMIKIDSLYGLGYRLTIQPEEADASVLVSSDRGRQSGTVKVHPSVTAACFYAQQVLQNHSPAAYDRAGSIINDVISQAPDYIPAKLVLAQCMASRAINGVPCGLQMIDEAQNILRSIERTEPGALGLQSQKANLLDGKWQFNEARFMHKQALLLSPENPVTHFNYGLHLLATGAVADAVTAFSSAIELNPFSPEQSIMHARSLAAAGASAIDVVEHAREAYRIHPDSQQVYLYLLGMLAFADPQPELAHAARQITLSRSSWIYAAGIISYVLAQCGDRDSALELIAAQATANVNIRITHLAALIAMDLFDEAVLRVKEAVRAGYGHLPILLSFVENSALKEHPEYPAILAHIFSR